MNSVAQGSGLTLCGCASSVSPPLGMPPPGTSDACLATGLATPLVKRTLSFSIVIGSYKYTCNVDDNLNPFQDCLNTMGKLCDSTFISGNLTRINECKNAVNSMTTGMSIHWQNVRKACGQWSYNGVTGLTTSVPCADANKALQLNSYYVDPLTLGKIYVTSALTDSVNGRLWNNQVLKG